MRIRDERPDNKLAIHAIVADAFGEERPADLVAALREAGDLVVSLVAEEEGQCVGHVGFSRLKSPHHASALAPVAVLEHRRRCGIGSALIREGLKQSSQLGYQIVFVVGEPRYYSRFGFSTELAARFPSSYAGPYFMAQYLTKIAQISAPVIYADAFDKLV